MRKSILAFAACLLLSIAPVAAGCGGGDREGSTAGGREAATGSEAGDREGDSRSADGSRDSGEAGGSKPTSEPESGFVAEANALCRKQKRQIKVRADAIVQSATGKGEQMRQAALRRLILAAIVPGLEAEAEQLKALQAPPGDEEGVEGVVAAIESVLAEARKDPTAFLGNAGAFDEPHRLAREYGIGACGTPS